MVTKRVFSALFGLILMIGFVSAWSVSMDYPLEDDYGQVIDYFTWSHDIPSENISECWYTLDEGATNTTMTWCASLQDTITPSIDGDNSWTVYVRDTNGVEYSSTSNFWVDSINPLISLLSPSANPFYTNNNVLDIEANLDEENPSYYYPDKPMHFNVEGPSGYSKNTYPTIDGSDNCQDTYSVFDEGAYIYTLTTEDIVEHLAEQQGTIIYDITEPSTTDNVLSSWYTSDAVITLTCYDGAGDVSGCDATYYTTEGVDPDTDSDEETTISITTDGRYTIKYFSVDKATNTEAIKTAANQVQLDKTPPTTSNDYSSTGWQTSDVTITLSPSDALSGVANTYYCIDMDNTCPPSIPYTETILISDEGTNYLRYISTDVAGNEEDFKAVEVQIDKTDPITNINSPDENSWQNSDFEVDISDSDVISDLLQCRYRVRSSLDGGINWNVTKNLGDRPCNSIINLKVGDNPSEDYCEYEGVNACKIEVFAVDNAGNSNEDLGIERIFSIDWTAPVINLTGDNPQTLQVNVDTYTEDGATISDNIDTDLTLNIEGEVNTNEIGEYIITYSAQDNAGNIATETRTVNVVDTTNPVINLTGDAIVEIELGETYTEEGATWTDNYDGTGDVVDIGGDVVDTDTIATYTITYDYTDANGNPADQITRDVVVQDTIGPSIMVEPINNSVVDGTILLNFTAFDLSGVAYMIINISNSTDLLIGGTVEDYTISGEVNTTYDDNGDYYFDVIACDTLGNCRTSNTITTVANPESVSPAPIQTYSSGGGSSGGGSCRNEEWTCTWGTECINGLLDYSCNSSCKNKVNSTQIACRTKQPTLTGELGLDNGIIVTEEGLNQTKGFISRLTGATVGAATSGTGIAIIVVALLGAAGAGVAYYRRRK